MAGGIKGDITSILNDLVATAKDGAQAFRTAAEDARDPALREMFIKRTQDCAKGAQQRQEMVVRMGGQGRAGRQRDGHAAP